MEKQISRKPKIFILGANGMIGHKVYQTLSTQFDVYGSLRKLSLDSNINNIYNKDKLCLSLDLINFVDLQKYLDILNPDIVINACGVTIRRGAEENLKITYLTNSILPHLLDKWAGLNSKWVIHFSTDCVFSGKKGNYNEFDLPDAIDSYGHSKGIGESNLKNTLVLRGSYIGRELNNYTELLEWLISNNNKTIFGYSNVIYSGLTTIRIAKYLNFIINHHYGITGLFNVSSNPISKFDLLTLLIKKFQLNIRVENNNEYYSNKNLISDKFFALISKDQPDWNDLSDELVLDSNFNIKIYK